MSEGGRDEGRREEEEGIRWRSINTFQSCKMK